MVSLSRSSQGCNSMTACIACHMKRTQRAKHSQREAPPLLLGAYSLKKKKLVDGCTLKTRLDAIL
jgi:cytochrome c553